MKRAHKLDDRLCRDPHWKSRGYLPHFDDHNTSQFVTFRLADSLPAHVIQRIEWELRTEPETIAKASLRKKLDEFLDSGTGECWLRDPRIAILVENALLHFDGERYNLHSWVVMPNHVHVLYEPVADTPSRSIVGSWKSYTALEANKILGRSGHFWCKESFDRYIRNARHFRDVVGYIEHNPVVAGLCQGASDWPWSSARRK